MRAEDVTDTLDMALAASGCNHATVLDKPRLLSDNGPSHTTLRDAIDSSPAIACAYCDAGVR